MYVSSYNVYLASNSSDRVEQKRADKERPSSSFSLPQESKPQNSISNLAVDYISRNIGFWQKQEFAKELQEKPAQNNPSIFRAISDAMQAKESYEQNSKPYSISAISKSIVVDQSPKISSNYSDKIQEIKERNMRSMMINTYISNDKYYRVTA